MKLDQKHLAQMIDHTLLKADARYEDFDKLCQEAMEYGFKMVAINSFPVAYCAALLKDSNVHVGAAIGFPLGQTSIETKVFEVQDAIRKGCHEIDYVINISELKQQNYAYIENEMRQIVEICRESGIIAKVILETCYLSNEEKIKVCEIAKVVKPDFVKTSTGFGTKGATVEDVALMHRTVEGMVAVKAAGGIRDLSTALAMIEAGATRIGTSSGISIVREWSQSHTNNAW